jgi:import inner membrane translocase subunit TIM23
MDKELYEHIKRNRVDPRFQSVSNLPPDYYGEKVSVLLVSRDFCDVQRSIKRDEENL